MSNKQRLTKWRDALLSGEYSQTRGTLNDGRGMCCLGVACTVSQLGHWVPGGAYEIVNDEDHNELSIGTFSDLMKNYYGVSDTGVLVSDNSIDAVLGEGYAAQHRMLFIGHSAALTQLNDEGVSFEDIAKIITLEFGLDN